MTCRIMDSNFNFLGEIDDYEQLLFKRLFVSYGDFEMSIGKDKKNTEYLQRGNIIVLDKNHIGFIEHLEIKQDSKYESLLIKGFTLEKLLSYRITKPHIDVAEWTQTASAETVIKDLVSYNLGSYSDTGREIKEIIIADDLRRGEEIEFKTAYKSLDEEVKSICMNKGVGIQFTFDSILKKFIFDVVFGKDLTAGQNINPPVIFSSDFDNIFEQKLIDNTMDYKNTAITGGKGEGISREIITIYENDAVIEGLDRREVFADISDSSVTTEALPDKGREKLQEYAKIFTLDGKINTKHSMVFGKDYNLGDIITMRYANVTLDARITEVTENWDADGYSIECTFGNKLPTLLDKTKNGVRI